MKNIITLSLIGETLLLRMKKKHFRALKKIIKYNYNKEYADTHTSLKTSDEAEFLNEMKLTKCH